MRHTTLALLMTMLSVPCTAQPALDQLESQFRPEERRPAPLAREDVGFLGIVVDHVGEAEPGVQVLEVATGSPAARGGLRAGDLITALDGETVRDMRDFADVVSAGIVGQRLAFTVRRGERTQDVIVTLGKRPVATHRPPPIAHQPQGPSLPGLGGPPLASGEFNSRRRLLGVRTIPLTEQARQFLQLPVQRGALVVAIFPGSPADQAGLPLDAVIVAVDDQRVTGPDDLAAAIEAAGEGAHVELSYYTRGTLEKQRLALRDFAAAPPQSRDPSPPHADPAAPVDDEHAELVNRLRQLERRLGRLEALLERMAPPPGAFPPGPQPGDI